MTPKTFHLTTFGCQMNQADSQRLRGLLGSLGYTEIDAPETADFVVFNTCCVREHAEERLRSRVQALKKAKKANPHMVIAIAGCIAQKDRDQVLERLPLVDLVFGPNDLETLPELLVRVGQGGPVTGAFAPVGQFSGDQADGIVLERPHAAFVNIVRGCTNWCTYCIVPAVRGPEVSRPLDEIERFVRDLVGRGVCEVTLLGQNVNVYGRDIGQPDGLVQLFSRLSTIDRLLRLRFLTSHPRDFDHDTVARLFAIPKVMPQLHLPVQSGSDRVLTLMNRGYSRAHYVSLVAAVRRACPEVTLSTDIICGFPSETEAEFAETLSLVDEIGFDAAFMYYYSPRPGTRAVGLPGQLDESVRKERLARLIERQNAIALTRAQRLIGTTERVLVERTAARAPGHVLGSTPGGRIIDFAGEPALIGTQVPVRITAARAGTLSGERVAG